jgi:hypothetical protein
MRKKYRALILKAVIVAAFILGLFLIWEKRSTFRIASDQTSPDKEEKIVEEPSGPFSPISGLACENAQRRPFAVMLGGDTVARPLSGIGEADLVFEMQVIEGSMTRLMAVFVCASPGQIGAVRSARDDFIPLSNGLDAIYAHWGGSHFALDELATGISDNINALPNPYSAFYRQSGIVAPHNGFTSTSRLMNAAQKLGYRITGKFIGYLHMTAKEASSHGQEKKILRIGYAAPFNVSYEYSPEKNSYLRYRGGTKEIDKNLGTQVEAKNVVIMRAPSRPLEGQYNDVQVEGEGAAEYYMNGQTQTGKWKKDKNDSNSKLFFYDDSGKEIKFVPGSIWVEIADSDTTVTYQ